MESNDGELEDTGQRVQAGADAAGPAGDRLTIVGIGASAGGLNALRAFFEALPADTGLAFVVVTHLNPEHKSEMAGLLQSQTAMPVIQVTDAVHIAADHVYVIPPDRRLLATDHQLSIYEFDEPRGQRMPIDYFFRSLAEVHGDGFAILLSGGGTDGTVGMKAIKEGGGFLMVQDPQEAEYDSMPRSAIATGLVDLVLPVRELATHLAEYARHKPPLLEDPDRFTDGDEAVLQKIFTQLRSRTGHDFSRYKRSTVVRRIARRMHVHRQESLSDYLAFLRDHPGEAQTLFKELLIGVTTFFRDPQSWKALTEVIPHFFLGKRPGESIRAWVAGCSTGEEAYTLAILLCEYAATLDERPDIQIFASDLDEGALATAREGLYPLAIAADVSEERLKRFFTQEGHHYRVKEEIREMILFATHSLLRDPPFSRLDLITCRNLLIYLQRDLQEKVFQLFYYALRPNSYLYLGTSETPAGLNLFDTVDKTHRIYQAREQLRETLHLPSLPLMYAPVERLPPFPRAKPVQGASAAALHRQMLEDYAPPSIVVDEQHNVIHLSETVGRYLQHPAGPLTSDVTRLVRPELRLELRNALQQAFEKGKTTVGSPVHVQFNGSPHPVYMTVRPSRPRKDAERLALIVFIEDEAREETPASPDMDAQTTHATVLRLEDELQMIRERLQANIEESEAGNEELKAANEELQSINEEYRSTTEELETSKEELQSVNEELHTVNSELKNKLDEVSRAHSDLQNLMGANDIGTLFLDRDLRIKRYTPRMRDLFNIMPTDQGRPISDLTHSLRYDGMELDGRQVLTNLAPIEREIRGGAGRWFLMRLRPYRTVEDRIDGVVITFFDITERRRAEEALRNSEERYRILLENVREYAVFMMDTDRRITTWNTGAERLFGYTEAEALGRLGDEVFTAEDRAGGAPLQEAEKAAREGQASNEREHVRKGGARFWGTGIMTALYGPAGELRGLAKVMRDNTERKLTEDRLKQLNETLEERVGERTRQVRTLASTLTVAEHQERRRISQILHDDLQQLLYGLQMKLMLIRREATSGDPARARDFAEEAGEWIGRAIKTTRQLTVDLSPPVLKDEGLSDALHWLVSQMEEMHDLKVKFTSPRNVRILNEGLRALLFQVVRELLFNVVKHAGTDHATVELLEQDGGLVIRVLDEGKGFDVAAAEAHFQTGGGFGLFSVRERIGLMGGRLEITSQSGGGTQVTVHIPIDPEAPPARA